MLSRSRLEIGMHNASFHDAVQPKIIIIQIDLQ